MLKTVCRNTSFMFPISYLKIKVNNKHINRDEPKRGYIVLVVFGRGLMGQVGRVLITLLTCIRKRKKVCVILTYSSKGN